MKTRLLIIVGIIAIGMISVFAINNGHDLFHAMNLPYEWHDSFGFTDTNVVRSAQCASEELGWLEPCIDVKMVSDNTAEQLEAILEHCIDSKDLVDTIGLSYDNGTHRIDTVNCKWVDIAKIPKGEIFEMNRNELSQVLDWCNDTSKVKYGFYNFSNETHSVNTSTCEWEEHGTYPTNDSLCVPYVDKWIAGGDWSNKTHYFDTVSCTWKDDPNYDAVNSKGCPQFCPKEKTSSLNEGLDNESKKTFDDIVLIDTLNNIQYDMYRDSDTHYERVDRQEKYYGSMTDIQLVNGGTEDIKIAGDDAIRITFDANYFQFGNMTEQIPYNPEFIAIINKNQTFIAQCNSFHIPNMDNVIPAKQIHILKYIGITEKNDTDYFGFVHEAGYVSDEIDCKFPDMISHSLNIDFDIIENNYYGDVWDHDWD
ncbi:hypothetical protein [Nitrosopumilus adriaticus]|uniref:hypothetical protein n=1 Tax=Nitrosopumilus adriaticus TaxID=1580092 RepID=UPI00352F5799